MRMMRARFSEDECALNDLEPDERVRRIEAFLTEASGEGPVEVRGLRRLAGGSSRQVWSLDVVVGRRSTPLPLVLRIDPTPKGVPGLTRTAAGFEGEFALLSAVHREGVPVPRVYWACAEVERLGGPFYLMERVEGETIPRRILRSEDLAKARELLPAQLGRALARIHRVPIVQEGEVTGIISSLDICGALARGDFPDG